MLSHIYINRRRVKELHENGFSVTSNLRAMERRLLVRRFFYSCSKDQKSGGTDEMTVKKAAKGLGWFSIGLGMAELLAPKRLGHMIGVGEHSGTFRALGLREIATGVGVLARRRPKTGLWARVAGDAMDVALLAKALGNRGTRKGRIAGAAGMVLGVGVLDYLCARNIDEEE